MRRRDKDQSQFNVHPLTRACSRTKSKTVSFLVRVELPLQVKRTRDVLTCGKLGKSPYLTKTSSYGLRDICIKNKKLFKNVNRVTQSTFVFASAIAVGSRVV